MWGLIVDGQVWQDADGNELFTLPELVTLAAHVESLGYTDIDQVQVAYVTTGEA